MREQNVLCRLLCCALLIALALFSVGCPSSNCAEGTVEKDGKCVASSQQITCGEGTVEKDGECVLPESLLCDPRCASGVECGDDGCGGSCGECGEDKPFCMQNRCVAECTPDCNGKACGDDGCGGSCGECDGGGACSTSGQCITAGFTCGVEAWADGVYCDCSCGIADPDCDNAALPVRGCMKPGATCDAQSACTGGFEGMWTCDAGKYGDGMVCDCGCGLPDPDCQDAQLIVEGCGSGVCKDDGTCGECVPDCADRTCGEDGCGGSCGECTEAGKPFCQEGACKATCEPVCGDNNCGDDGCGGSCGTCADGKLCAEGKCSPPPEFASCKDRCGEVAPSGCSCSANCVEMGTCCQDAEVECGCFPKCTDKTCGDDGCGGSCGGCGDGFKCGDAGTCVNDLCDPDPCNGHGTCDPMTGACTCIEGYAGIYCDSCAQRYTGYPMCQLGLCNAFTCSGRGLCMPLDGSCRCDAGFTGASCNMCEPGKGTFPNCMP